MARRYMYTSWEELPLIINLPAASVLLNIHPDTLKKNSQKGEFPAFKAGGVWRVEKDALREWIRQNMAMKI